ncbi:MAG TPA: hypothetical protein VMS18_29395 [Candidatus Binatia bacterium]|nr:hypothetical protein [Candidatus Binatia bacterium]
MTRKLLAIALALTLFGALGSAFAGESCNNRLLFGSYGFTIEGTKLAGNGPIGPQKGVAMAEFDGDGNFTQIDTVVIDGVVVADFSHTPANGTYTVNSNCTGTFTIVFTDNRPPVVTNFVVVNSGKEIDTVVTTVGGNQGVLTTSSVGKKVSSR